MKLTKQEKQDLEEFSRHIDYWVVALGLSTWDIQVKFSNDKENATVLLNVPGRKAYIALCRKREKSISLEQLAIHECLEISFGDISLELGRHCSEEDTQNMIHAEINRLMPILLEFRKK
jgi:hypothetical protein